MACERRWPMMGSSGLLNQSDCSSFVNAVAKDVGIELNGDANQIFVSIKQSPWSFIGQGDHGAHLAAVAATNGDFVIGAYKNPGGHGHVAVIVDTNYHSMIAAKRERALAYWGQIGPKGQESTGAGRKRSVHSLSWGASIRNGVIFASRPISI